MVTEVLIVILRYHFTVLSQYELQELIILFSPIHYLRQRLHSQLQVICLYCLFTGTLIWPNITYIAFLYLSGTQSSLYCCIIHPFTLKVEAAMEGAILPTRSNSVTMNQQPFGCRTAPTTKLCHPHISTTSVKNPHFVIIF